MIRKLILIIIRIGGSISILFIPIYMIYMLSYMGLEGGASILLLPMLGIFGLIFIFFGLPWILDTKNEIQYELYKISPEYKNWQNALPNKLVQAIKDFEPSYRWKTEEGYHAELTNYLKNQFPNLEVEKQIGSSRPDIVVQNIAIEIKGPTTAESMNTLASKCMRYNKHFPSGLIIVLFDIRLTQVMLKDYLDSLPETFPNIIGIIEK
jgi:hypothetical protein